MLNGGQVPGGSRDQLGPLEMLQTRRKKARSDTGQALEKVLVTLRASDELANDQERPPLANDIQGPRGRAELVV